MTMKKKVKRKVSRKVVKRKKVAQKSPLSSAIKDLEFEVKKLGSEKSEFKTALSRVSSSLDSSHNLERDLQRKIARIIEKEAKLNKKRKVLGTKIDGISDKLNKISKIRSEMSDI